MLAAHSLYGLPKFEGWATNNRIEITVPSGTLHNTLHVMQEASQEANGKSSLLFPTCPLSR
eukprot:3814247-Amphidinium_carterae.1